MPWTPSLYSASRHRIAKNLLAFISANQTQAIAWARGVQGVTQVVPDFRGVHNSTAGRIHNLFPDLMLVRATTEFPEDESGHVRTAVHTFGFEMEIAVEGAAFAPDKLTELVEVYMTTLDSMIRECPHAVLINGLPDVVHVESVDVTSHDRDQTRGAGTLFLQTPTLVARVTVLEVIDVG